MEWTNTELGQAVDEMDNEQIRSRLHRRWSWSHHQLETVNLYIKRSWWLQPSNPEQPSHNEDQHCAPSTRSIPTRRCVHEVALAKSTVPGKPVLDTLEERISPNTPTALKVEQSKMELSCRWCYSSEGRHLPQECLAYGTSRQGGTRQEWHCPFENLDLGTTKTSRQGDPPAS